MFSDVSKIKEIALKNKQDNFYSRIFYRKISVYLTSVLLKTGISADQVTLISIIIALVGCFLITFQSLIITIFGLLAIHFWYLLDHVDGEIARYTKTSSLESKYLDVMSHYFVHPIIFFSFGVDAAFYVPDILLIPILFAGLLAGVSSIVIDLSSALRLNLLFGKALKKPSRDYIALTIRLKQGHPVGRQSPLFKTWKILWNVFCMPGALWFLTFGSILKINYILIPVYAGALTGFALVAITVRLKGGLDTVD